MPSTWRYVPFLVGIIHLLILVWIIEQGTTGSNKRVDTTRSIARHLDGATYTTRIRVIDDNTHKNTNNMSMGKADNAIVKTKENIILQNATPEKIKSSQDRVVGKEIEEAISEKTTKAITSVIRNNTQKKVQGNGMPRKFPNSLCSSPTEAVKEPKDEIFQPIAGSTTYIYSAFAVSPSDLRIILIYNTTEGGQFSCQFRTSHMASPVVGTTIGKVQGILDGHGVQYNAAFLNCKLPTTNVNATQLLVSVVTENCKEHPFNLLPVQRQPGQTSFEFTVCVAPFHHNYDAAFALVEMIELNKILGAEHFYFYNESCSPGVAKVLKHYQDQGMVNVVQWHLPFETDNKQLIQVHYHGQNAAINDCLYRNRKRSRYVVIADVDEFIVPHVPNVTNWSQFVKYRLSLNPNKTNFLFKNNHFRKEWKIPDYSFPQLVKAKKFKSITLQHVQREDIFDNYRTRSKYIMNPLHVNEGGIHYVHRVSSEWVDFVPETDAFVHHYKRRWNTNNQKKRLIDDIVVKRYGAALAQALENAWNKIGMP